QRVGALGGGQVHDAHAALRCRARRWSPVQVSTKCSISAAVVVQPKLTRIVASAIAGSRPIAARTWLGPTLPDEQAAPALTITPARSNAITWVSAGIPGIASAEVLGRRGTPAPITIASGRAASRRSRSARTLS